MFVWLFCLLSVCLYVSPCLSPRVCLSPPVYLSDHSVFCLSPPVCLSTPVCLSVCFLSPPLCMVVCLHNHSLFPIGGVPSSVYKSTGNAQRASTANQMPLCLLFHALQPWASLRWLVIVWGDVIDRMGVCRRFPGYKGCAFVVVLDHSLPAAVELPWPVRSSFRSSVHGGWLPHNQSSVLRNSQKWNA